MDTFLMMITARSGALIRSAMGPAADQNVLGPIDRADICVAVLYLALAASFSAAAAYMLKRRLRSSAASNPKDNLPNHVLTALLKPLYIVILIYGLYFAATPALMKLKPEEGLQALRGAMDLLFDLGAFVALFWFLFRATHALESRLALWASTTPSKIDDLLVPLLGTSLRIVVTVVGVILGLPALGLASRYADIVAKLTSMAFITAVAILLFRGVSICQQVVLTRFDITAADNLRARKVFTQLHVISRVVYVVIGIVAVAAVLMLFQQVRHVGTSLLASAGVVGIVAGFAAQKTLANLFAGFQIALAQPVRQDDVIVVEGEWGRVEEITLTYVIVHIWDDRRLVLPLSYFIEKPFQNWTRTSAALLGSVFVWVDYTFPVDDARKALKDIIEGSPLWDRRFWNLQVTDAGEKTLQLRVLATSANSSSSFDLRCEIRERFIAYIQRNHPQSLPRTRAEILGPQSGQTA